MEAAADMRERHVTFGASKTRLQAIDDEILQCLQVGIWKEKPRRQLPLENEPVIKAYAVFPYCPAIHRATTQIMMEAACSEAAMAWIRIAAQNANAKLHFRVAWKLGYKSFTSRVKQLISSRDRVNP